MKEIGQLLGKGYQRVPKDLFFAACCLSQPIFSEEVVAGRTIYDVQWKVDFILYHPERWPECLVVQCRWQMKGGTTDEKYPYDVACIKDGKYPAVIVLDGGGYRKIARQWLLNQRDNKLRAVCSRDEFRQMQEEGRI